MSVSIGPSLVHCISIAMRNAQKRSKMVDCSLRGAQPPIAHVSTFLRGAHVRCVVKNLLSRRSGTFWVKYPYQIYRTKFS